MARSGTRSILRSQNTDGWGAQLVTAHLAKLPEAPRSASYHTLLATVVDEWHRHEPPAVPQDRRRYHNFSAPMIRTRNATGHQEHDMQPAPDAAARFEHLPHVAEDPRSRLPLVLNLMGFGPNRGYTQGRCRSRSV